MAKQPKVCSCGVVCDTVALEMEHGIGCRDTTNPHGEDGYHKHCVRRQSAEETAG